MPIAVFRPDPHIEVNSVDGYAQRQGVDQTWAALIVGAGVVSGDAGITINAAYARCSATPNQYQTCGRGKIRFDTSILGAGVTINNAVFSLWGTLATNNLGQSVAVCSQTGGSDITVVAADFARANFGLVDFAPRIAIAAWNVGAYNDFTLNAAGLAAIDPVGMTRLGTMISGDIDGVAPVPWANGTIARAYANSADQAGIANDPMLTIDYSLAGGGQSARARSGIIVPQRRYFRFG